ncbi:MAG: alanine--glyoxylate aminotransferase family protein [Clostridiales bacterium]|jgi:alanine-glyoxylate transaminase/serine-glyoxylate transaminase/serine-pyruvate transaminase|nr:alanine--glyoxylate aminotransferase family protein [Clostridiales bacterium]
MNLLENIRTTLLMGPGPSCVHPLTYYALGRPTLGHLDPYFITIMDEIKADLQTVMGTKNVATIPISGTGSAGMETSFVNMIEPGDRVLVLINGVFGMRMADVAGRLGAEVDTIEFEWGTAVDPEEVEKKLKEKSYDIVAVVHAETSTGVCNPVEEISKILADTDSLYLVDTVTSLCGMPVEMDKWGIDICYSGSQKCISCPPGIAPVSFSDRAMEKLNNRKTKVPNWYLDVSMIAQYWGGKTRAYHHTAPINMLYALYQSLKLIIEEGLENVYKRHMECHKMLVAGIEELGFKMLVKEGYRLPMLNAVLVPDSIDEAELRKRLLNEYNIEVGAGLGALAGKIVRIGLMGHTARDYNVKRLLDALSAIIK